LSKHRRQIDAAFRFDSVEEILDCLDGCGEHFLHVAASRIRMNSPSCLKIALRALRKARRLASLDECLAMEYRVGQRLAISNDFLDGVRAVVIDKNGTPRWRPAELSGVSDRVVEEHFEQLGEKELWVMA
jgi:enoyl-CoA hydratase